MFLSDSAVLNAAIECLAQGALALTWWQIVLAALAMSAAELSRLNFELGEAFGRAALRIGRGRKASVIGSCRASRYFPAATNAT